MSMKDEDRFTIWVCVDCMHHHANGECSGCPNVGLHEHDREPWAALFEREPEGANVTMGLLAEEHHEDCDYRVSTAAQEVSDTFGLGEDHRGYECNCGCDEMEFSWSACDGCGSSLGGSRYAFTLWTPNETGATA